MAYALPLEFEPGSRWSYSNTGYMLLGIIVHRVSGKFYGDILRDRVFAPLGMKSARIISEADIVLNRSAGYQLLDGDLKNQDWVSPTLNTTADGALYLSLNDYLAWDRGLRAGALLRPESWSAIYTAVILKSGRTYPYGFGWEVDRALGEPWYYHGGSWQGFRTFISRYLADDLTVIVLANLADAMPDRFVDGITRVIDSRLPRLEPDRAIVDHNPEITERVRVLLRSVGAGTLSEVDLPAMRRDFFPEELQAYKELLAPLTVPVRLELLERRELGDDLRYSYLAVFPQRTLFVAMTLTAENQVADASKSSRADRYRGRAAGSPRRPRLTPVAGTVRHSRKISLRGVLPRALLDAQISHHGHGLPRDAYAFEPRPHGASLAHLMRLEAVEVAKAGRALDRQRLRGHCRVIELETASGADNNPVETFILAGGSAARPGVGDGNIGPLANRIGTDIAARLDHPFGFIFPELLVGELEGTTVLRLDARQAGIAVSAITKQGELALADVEALQHFLGFPEIGGAAAYQGERIAHVAIDTSINSSQIARRRDVAGLGDQSKGFAATEDL